MLVPRLNFDNEFDRPVDLLKAAFAAVNGKTGSPGLRIPQKVRLRRRLQAPAARDLELAGWTALAQLILRPAPTHVTVSFHAACHAVSPKCAV